MQCFRTSSNATLVLSVHIPVRGENGGGVEEKGSGNLRGVIMGDFGNSSI